MRSILFAALCAALVSLGGCFGLAEGDRDGTATTTHSDTGTNTTTNSTTFPPSLTSTPSLTLTNTSTSATSTTSTTGTDTTTNSTTNTTTDTNTTSGARGFGNGTVPIGNGTNGTNGTNATNGTANGTAPRGPVTWNITMEDGAFLPQNLTIQQNDTVQWTHTGDDPHTVTADDGSFDSSPGCGALFDPFLSQCMEAGDTFSWTFNATSDAFGYHSKVDGAPGSGMYGTITVLERFDGRPT